MSLFLSDSDCLTQIIWRILPHFGVMKDYFRSILSIRSQLSHLQPSSPLFRDKPVPFQMLAGVKLISLIEIVLLFAELAPDQTLGCLRMTNDYPAEPVHARIETLYHTESRRIFATLIRLLGDFELAEEALQEAFKSALEQWPVQGMPSNPRAWLISTGRFKAIDTLRRGARFEAAFPSLAASLEQASNDPIAMDDAHLEDDRLRLIFICCHPSLSQEARVALTLREVCGLTNEAVAHAFFTTPTTLAQRIVRAKAKIREAHLPYEVPSREELPARLDGVLQVIYLVFNEGYYPALGGVLVRPDFSEEAIRLGRLLVSLLPSQGNVQPEAIGLLALMLLHESRRPARLSPEGEMVRTRGPGPEAVEPGVHDGGDFAGQTRVGGWPAWPLYASGCACGYPCKCTNGRRNELGPDHSIV